MKISEDGLAIIKQFEGYKERLPDGSCRAYQCVVGRKSDGSPIYDGKWTIGWGCTRGVYKGLVWTLAQAEAALREEVATAEEFITRLVTAPLNQCQFDALVSFGYNVGEPQFAGSTLRRKLNAGDYEGAAKEFGRWVNSNGVKAVPGLVRRRREEAALFLRPATQEESEAEEMPQTIEPEETCSRDMHAEAHSAMQQISSLYNANRWAVKGIGGGVTAAVAFARENAFEIALVAFTAVTLLLLMQLAQRNGWLRQNA